jgi:hypothetical protein
MNLPKSKVGNYLTEDIDRGMKKRKRINKAINKKGN